MKNAREPLGRGRLVSASNGGLGCRGHAFVAGPEQGHLQARAIAAGGFQGAFGQSGLRGEALDGRLQFGDLGLVIAAGLVLRFLHAIEARPQLLGALLCALERLFLSDGALGQLVGAFDGGGAGGVDTGVTLAKAVGLFLQGADTIEGAFQGDVEVTGAAFHRLLLGAGVGETGRDLAVHFFQLVGATRRGLQAGLQGRDLGAVRLDLALEAADGATAVGLVSGQSVLDRLNARAFGGELGFQIGLDARQASQIQTGLVDALLQRRGLFAQQGVVLVGAGQRGLGVAAAGVDLLSLQAQAFDVLHQVLDARGGVAQRGVEAGDLQV